jgi:hypothetical protein
LIIISFIKVVKILKIILIKKDKLEMSIQDKNLKNFNRIKKVISNKLKSDPLSFVFVPALSELISGFGFKFLEKKGMNIYMKTVKSYWVLIKDKS